MITPLPTGWLDPRRRAERQRNPWFVLRVCSPTCRSRHTWEPIHGEPGWQPYRRGRVAYLCTGDIAARNRRESRESEEPLSTHMGHPLGTCRDCWSTRDYSAGPL